MQPHEIMLHLRSERGLSQKEVYTAIGMKQQTYSNKERGIRKLKPHEKKVLAAFYNKPADVFDTPAAPALSALLPETVVDLKDVVIIALHKMLAMEQEMKEIKRKLEEKET